MTTTKDFASKLAVALVAVAMVFSAFASSAKAQTTEELQAMINDLLAQVAALQASTGATAVGGACVSIAQPLTVGATGADVTALQNRLIADGQSIPAGATGYFGSQTRAALGSWQAAHAVAPAVGYYGPITRAAMDASCTPADEVDTDPDDSSDDSDVTLSGEASLDEFTIDDADDDTVQEGADDVEIGVFTVVFTNGDAEISRLDVALQGGGDETDPWDTFDSISLWVDGDKIAEEDADSRSDYLDEDKGSLRFSGLDLIGMEDEEVEITVAANIQSGMDDGADGEDWELFAGSIRFFDADGVATTEDSQEDLQPIVLSSTQPSASFTIEEAGFDDEVIVKTSSNDPDAITLQVEDDSKSDWYNVFTFDLDTDDSINDITFNTIVLEVIVGTSTGGYNALVDDAEIVIDGVTIDDVTVTNGTTATATLTFDVDREVTVDAGDRVEAELMLRFKSLATLSEGVTVQGRILSATTANIDAEGADDLANSQLSGSATGEAHTLRTTGIDVSKTDTSAAVTVSDGALNDYATFSVEVEVTAFNQDVFIAIDDTVSIDYSLVDSSGNAYTVPTASSSVVLSSSADEGGAASAFFQINEGETETITLTVTYTPVVANRAVRLQLNSISFDETGTATTTDDDTQTTLPATAYRTAVVTIVN